MPNITVFSGDFCRGASVVREVLDRTGFSLVTDQDLVARASELSGMEQEKIERTFSSKISIFNKFTHEKERSIAYLRLAMAEMLAKQGLLMEGFLGHLIPKEITDVLRVCLIADIKFRVSAAVEEKGLSQHEATKTISKLDEERAHWVNTLTGSADPWNPDLYDIVIPMGKTGVEEAATLIEREIKMDVLQPTSASKQAIEDFLLAARSEVALSMEGHEVGVKAKDGVVTLAINKHVLMLSRLEEELKSIVSKLPGVRAVETTVGKGYYKTDIYRKYDFEAPSRVLLVDDEREFVQTLSERLIMRDMGSAVAYDGESALNLIAEDEPEVMILDLKMPGIDGIEVLRQVKKTRPQVEVIILTGHGSEADRETCMGLGAFAYLHKPVDIEVLSNKLKEANEKIRQKKALTG
jgi:two-component system response regulator CpxR